MQIINSNVLFFSEIIKKLFIKIGTIILFILLFTGCISSSQSETVSEKMEFWQNQKKGANGNWQTVKPKWFQAADEAGFQFIRFNASWFEADEYDFLIGNVDHFTEINQNDLSVLLQALDEAHLNNQKIVLTMFELPGCRDSNAAEESDYRLWQDESFQQQAFDFWRQLAKTVKDHPAIVAYNPLNEPHPERAFGYYTPNADFQRWLKEVEGTTADLNKFNSRMVEAIREVDPDMPILLDGYFYADPSGLPYMKAIDDPNILYAFHNPAPWEFANYQANNGKYRYPDQMPDYGSGPVWAKYDLEKLLEPVLQFIEENDIKPYQIVASEVWCDRRVDGCAVYFADILSLYNEKKWHWAFYAFREDMSWTGLDYELGSSPVDHSYWEAIEAGYDYDVLKKELRHENPIWSVLKEEF